MAQSLARDLATLVFGVPVLFELAVGLFVVAAIRARNRRTVGRVLAEERPGRRLRVGLGSALLLAVFAALLLARPDARVLQLAALLLAPALGLVWFGTGFRDAVLGESGVQRGWQSRLLGELEEWRLAGDQLRFRLQGEWCSVPCPPELQPGLRGQLLRLNPGRESPLRD
jgi:hypothetical protein